MQGDEAGQGGVIWRRHPFQEIHKVDVSLAGCLDPSGRIDVVHIGIDHDLQQLTGACLILSDPAIRLVQLRKVHFLHKCV